MEIQQDSITTRRLYLLCPFYANKDLWFVWSIYYYHIDTIHLCGFDTIQRVLDMTPKVVGAAAAGSGANLEMASPGLIQIKWIQR